MGQNETRTLWISVGLALLAMFLFYSYTQEMNSALTKKFVNENVLVAKEDINEMDTIDGSQLEVVTRPKEFIDPNALSDPNRAAGKVALVPIKKGEQLLETKIQEPGSVTGLSIQVAPSRRAVTIPIDEARGVAKLLKPGDRIDLVAALDIGRGGNQRREVRTIMQDVEVLATGVKIANELPRMLEKVGREDYIRSLRGDTTFSTITVEASPQDSQNLIYILSTSPGSLFITLRHPSDRVKNNLTLTTVETFSNRADAGVTAEQVRQPASAPVLVRPVQTEAKPEPKKKRSGGFRNL
jgi:pilus assembly protein CpaB